MELYKGNIYLVLLSLETQAREISTESLSPHPDHGSLQCLSQSLHHLFSPWSKYIVGYQQYIDTKPYALIT